MKRKIIVTLMVSSCMWNVYAATELTPDKEITWSNEVWAADCVFMYPTLRPLSQQKNLIAENSLPNGSVLYSWGYDSFAPDFHARCRQGFVYSGMSLSSYPELIVIDRLDFNNLNDSLLAGEWLWETSNPGVALKLYVTLTSLGGQNTGYAGDKNSASTYASDIYNPIPVGQDIPLTPSFGITGVIEGTMNSILSGGLSSFHDGAHYLRYSVRGELIKIGDIQTGVPLFLLSASMRHAFFMNNKADGSQHEHIGVVSIFSEDIFGGGGVTFLKPTCQLRGAADYSFGLDEWRSATDLPAYGNIKTIGINIECSGFVDNVEFSFQDTGYMSLNNGNISLYDSLGGQSIEGLEIEMLYNEERLDVHKYNEAPTIYKINTGSHGSIKIDASDLNFNTQSQVQFGARFIQRAAITRAGNAYVGPVIGRVNMFVTYY